MKYLLYTLEYPPFKGGVANYYKNLIDFWPEKNIEILDNNNNELINNKLFFLKWLPAFFVLKKRVKNHKINHIIVGQILPLGTTVWFLSKIIKLRYSVILHGMDFTYALKKTRKKILSKLILSNAEKIICGNNYLADLIKKQFPDLTNKIKVVNPGIDTRVKINNNLVDKIKNNYQLDNKFVLFSLGRLVKRKGIDRVIDALPKVLKNIPNLQYFIAGTGPDEEYLKNILQQNKTVIQNVTFLGQISEEEKWAWLNLCDTFILPSRQINDDFEGFGIVYLEANLMSKSVIASNSGGVGDAVQDNFNGLLVNPNDSNNIAETIVKIANNQNLNKKLGEQGRERVVRQFNWQNQIKILYNYLNS